MEKEPKQETLEETAERLFSEEKYPTSFEILREAFISNAKWQAERMFSEEDMNEYADYSWSFSNENRYKSPISPREWFEKFKKNKI